MGSWNYPYVVVFKPLVQAITAGNCTISKCSELAPESAKVCEMIINKYLDPKCHRCINGGVDVSIEITKHAFDLICYTGSTEKGKLVAKAAADNLIPVVLELGGKCPMIVAESADVDYAAFKCSFMKFQNAG